MAANPEVGKLIDASARRDAIHVAVAPAQAARNLYPAQCVGLLRDGRATNLSDAPVGIVDPYLTDVVEPGAWFYIFLFPGSVTSLRHEWEHPAFVPAAAAASAPVSSKAATLLADLRRDKNYRRLPELADALVKEAYPDKALIERLRRSPDNIEAQRLVCLLLGVQLAASVEWIEDYAEEVGVTYETVMKTAAAYLEDDQEYHCLNYDTPDVVYLKRAEFWAHYAIVTDTVVASKNAESTFFHCAC